MDNTRDEPGAGDHSRVSPYSIVAVSSWSVLCRAEVRARQHRQCLGLRRPRIKRLRVRALAAALWVPPHQLQLKEGMPVMLDMDLANGTRLNGTALQVSCRTARLPQLLVCGLCLPIISLGLIDVQYDLHVIILGGWVLYLDVQYCICLLDSGLPCLRKQQGCAIGTFRFFSVRCVHVTSVAFTQPLLPFTPHCKAISIFILSCSLATPPGLYILCINLATRTLTVECIIVIDPFIQQGYKAPTHTVSSPAPRVQPSGWTGTT